MEVLKKDVLENDIYMKLKKEKVNKRIYLSSPHMGEEEMGYIQEAFNTNWIAPLGPNVDKFESDIAKHAGVDAAAALTTGTSAIHMALKLLGVTKGDLVFCSSLTFVASCNPIIYEGAEPVFIDSEPESFNMSPVALQEAFKYYHTIGKKAKAVIVVHLYGQSADMDKIMSICNEYEVPVIEDAAESLGATYKGRATGSIGKFGIYSFNGNKIITTSGGGMLVSNDTEAIKKARFLATQARDDARYYQHSKLGYNYRMSNVLAGIGRGQLKVLNKRIEKKKEIFEAYKKAFIDINEIEIMPVCDYGNPNYWLSVITLSKASKVKPIDIILTLEKENIEARHIWKPIHMQPYYICYKFFSHYKEDKLSVAEDIFDRGVCLPSDTKMTEEDINRVISVIKQLFLKGQIAI